MPMLSGSGSIRRVLMTADAVGGVWVYALDLASALQARGIDVRLAVMGPRPDDAKYAEAVARGIRVEHGDYRLEWMDDAASDIERAGTWLLRLADDHRPDVVHLNGFSHAALPWRAPVVVVAHSCVRSWWRAVYGVAAPPSWVPYGRRVRRGLAAADRVVAPTQAMLGMLQREYGGDWRGQVIPNGCGNAAALPTGVVKEPFVISAGRLWDDAKNIAALCAVAPELSWPVVVAGDATGPDGNVRVPSGATHVGRLSSHQMQAWLARAAIYAHPARYEPFGLSVLEAAASGCALVLGDIRSLRENWSGAALFVSPHDRGALAAAIERLIADAPLRADLAARARARAALFTLDRAAAAYHDLYAELLAEHRRRAGRVRTPAVRVATPAAVERRVRH